MCYKVIYMFHANYAWIPVSMITRNNIWGKKVPDTRLSSL